MKVLEIGTNLKKYCSRETNIIIMITRHLLGGGGSGVVYIGIVNFSSLSMLHCPFCLDSGARSY